MNKFHLTPAVLALSVAAALPPRTVSAYPPAVGILGQSRNCLVCHADNGPWRDDSRLIIDILDQASGNSLKQKDGTFLISTKRGEAKTVLTVIGRAQGDDAPAPYRMGWLYVDPQRITEIGSLTKFARGWSVNLPMACRLVGDASKTYPGAQVTVLPMTVRPGDEAQDAEIELQVMLTKGESVKGKPQEGMLGNYFVRKVRLTVVNAKESGRTRSAARLPGRTCVVRSPARRETLPVVGLSVRHPDESGRAQGGRFTRDPEACVYMNPAAAGSR